MMVPALDSIWRYIGSGNGMGDIQRVIGADQVEVVTMSERTLIHQME